MELRLNPLPTLPFTSSMPGTLSQTDPSGNALPYIQGNVPLRKPHDLRHLRHASTTEPENTRADIKRVNKEKTKSNCQ